MGIENRKKDLEISIYEKEIYEELQKTYKEKFYKYANEDNYKIYSNESNKDLTLIPYPDSPIKDKNKYSEIVYKNINANQAFKKFIGKKIISEDEQSKKKTIHKYGTLSQCSSKDAISRITEIKNGISNIKNTLNYKIKLVNDKKLFITDILSYMLELDNKINAIITHGEINDMDFYNNAKYYKYINNFITCNKLNIFEIIQKLKSTSNDDKLDKQIKILNFNNILSFKKKKLYDQFKEVVYKIEYFESLLYEQNTCFNKTENIATILLSFYLFLSLCLNDNMNKRILNYIYLANLKKKHFKEYLESEKNVKTLKILSNFKSSIHTYSDEKSFMDIFLISLNRDNEILLQLYKKFLDNKITVDIISNETDKINNTIAEINKNLDKNNKMMKSFLCIV